MPTLPDLESRYLERQRAAERRKAAAEADLRAIVATCKTQGRSHMTLAETGRAEQCERELIAARGELDACALALSEVGTARADESRIIAAQSRSYPTGARRPAGGDRGDHGPRWVREDGRPAALERGQRTADDPVAAELIARDPARHIIEQHSGLGSLVRSLTTSGASALVPRSGVPASSISPAAMRR